MTASTGTAAKPAAVPALPAISVARFEEGLLLVERMVAENTSVFIQHAQDYRAEHRKATDRPLSAVEAAQIAAGVLDERSPEDRAAAFLGHEGLRAYDEPAPTEVLLAAGVATAPAFLRAALRVTALIEMPDGTFEEARELRTLNDEIDAHVETLRGLGLQEARERASAALDHFGKAAGVEPGKAWGLLARSVWQALQQAVSQLNLDQESPSSSLIDSAANTDGPDEPSSTTPPIATPSLS